MHEWHCALEIPRTFLCIDPSPNHKSLDGGSRLKALAACYWQFTAQRRLVPAGADNAWHVINGRKPAAASVYGLAISARFGVAEGHHSGRARR
jgi:hypothetical protein